MLHLALKYLLFACIFAFSLGAYICVIQYATNEDLSSGFLGGINSEDKSLTWNLHPVLMTLSFTILILLAILSFRIKAKGPGPKYLHTFLHTCSLASFIIGIKAAKKARL